MKNLELLNETQNFAVIGMNTKKKTYAHKIFTLLEKKGKTAFAVNPNYKEEMVEDVTQIGAPVDIAVMLVNPKIGVTLLEGLQEKEIKTLWFQPGSHDEALILKATEMGFNVIEDCVLDVYYKADHQ